MKVVVAVGTGFVVMVVTVILCALVLEVLVVMMFPVMPLFIGVFRPDAARAEIEQRDSWGRGKRHDAGLAGQHGHRLGQEGLHALADPEDGVRGLKTARIGGLERVGVGRRATLHQQCRIADPRHDPGDEGMDGTDAGDDPGRGLCGCDPRCDDEQGGSSGLQRRSQCWSP